MVAKIIVDSDVCLVFHHEEQLHEFRKVLADISRDLLSLDLDDSDEFMISSSTTEVSNYPS